MERLLRGEQHSLDQFSDPEASSRGVSRRRSHVDFGDVFGGPPRNPSVYDLHRSLGESVSGYGGFGGEEAGRSRRLRPSLGEKPVFGEGFSSPSPRRKDFGEDFFSDIFRGGDLPFSTPRRLEWEPMSSASSSRVLSPVRSLPPRSEGFGGSPSLPSQLSFSKKMAEELEKPLFVPSPDNSLYKSEGSDLDAGVYMPTIAHHVTENQDDFKTNAHASFHRSSLSSRFSHDQDLSPKTIPAAGIGIGGNFKEDSIGSRASTVGRFHFSIYKWASKGVMLVVPSNSKDRSKNESRHSGLPVPFLQGVDIPSSNKLMPTFFPSEVQNQHCSSSSELGTPKKTTVDSVKILEKSLPKKFRPMSLPTSIIPEPGSVAENPQAVSGSVYSTGSSTKINEEVPVFMREPHNPITWNLQDMIDDHYGRDEKEDNKQDDEKADLVSCTTSTISADSSVEVKRKTSKMSVIDQPNAQDISVALKEKMPNGRVRGGKVKEFIKIFDQEISCKPAGIIESQAWDPKVKDFGKFKVEEQVKPHATNTTEEEKIYGNYSGEQSNAPFMVEQILKEEKLHSDMDSDVVNDNESSHVKEEASKPCFESTQVSSKASFDIAEELHYEVEEFQVEYILEEKNELPQANSDLEDIQNSDAKIRAWSAGKEGNIRSMLSTLQYVLWTGSGWKPVPLVDIIEGSSVKRAYQKALLCLHPDKLQQRGAPLHQKYIAEKVFGILQEAWDHFHTSNTL